MNLKGEPAHVGRHCGSNTYAVTPEGVAFYSEALGDDSPLYHELAPPLLFHSECFRFVGDWYLKNLFGNLHAQQDWDLFAPIAIGSRVRSRSTIVDRWSKRGRDYVVNETDLCDAEDGRLLVRGRTYQSFLPPAPTAREAAGEGGGEGEGQAGGKRESGFVVDASTARRKTPRPPFPTATGRDLEPVEKSVDERRCWMFSGPGKNYHTDREEARKLGFPSIVVQGMMSTCFVAQLMQQSFGMGWVAGGRMSLKFTNVLWVDETVTAFGKVREEIPEGTSTRVHCDVWVEKADATRVSLGTASALLSAR